MTTGIATVQVSSPPPEGEEADIGTVNARVSFDEGTWQDAIKLYLATNMPWLDIAEYGGFEEITPPEEEAD